MMNTKELNEYILNYLKNDKTQTAIMLTAPWGTGKSYYIKNTLIPAIDTADEKKCIVVSLYGLKNISEISKSIYLEIRVKKISKLSEKLNVGKLIGKTIIKGVTSFFGIDVNTDENDLQQLYESIDLTGKLIILEDLERSQIDIIEVMGYVNNLCEQDGVKVLLVANEREILKYEDETIAGTESKEKKTKTIKVLTEQSKEYLKIKEKTVSDTIIFPPYVRNSVINIMKGFNNKYFNDFLEEKDDNGRIPIINALEKDVMGYEYIQCYNLRSFIIACQKTIELYDNLKKDKEHDLVYLKYLLLTITAFVLRKKQNDNLSWDNKEDQYRSARLGTSQYPLPEFCYNYICLHYLDKNELSSFESTYCNEQKILMETRDISDNLKPIYSYFEYPEKEVIDALNKIKPKLADRKVPFSAYGMLACSLVKIKSILDISELFDELKMIMINSLKFASPEDTETLTINNYIYFESPELISEYKEFFSDMSAVIKKQGYSKFDFDYKINNINKLQKYVFDNRNEFINKRLFAGKFDNDKLVLLLENCSPKQIEIIRDIFQTVYLFPNLKDFFAEDKEPLIDLKQKIETLLSTSTNLDRIQMLQLNYFISNLEDYINKL